MERMLTDAHHGKKQEKGQKSLPRILTVAQKFYTFNIFQIFVFLKLYLNERKSYIF